jgi:hypothetical protein
MLKAVLGLGSAFGGVPPGMNVHTDGFEGEFTERAAGVTQRVSNVRTSSRAAFEA